MNDAQSWRRYVHTLANRMVFTGSDFAQYLPELLRMKVPDGLVGAFLHGSAHHATLHLPFWTGLSFVRSQGQRQLFSSPGDDAPAARRFIVDCLVERALSPLMEGLACFAEFDLSPGSSSVVSKPSEYLATLYMWSKLQYRRNEEGPRLFLESDAGLQDTL